VLDVRKRGEGFGWGLGSVEGGGGGIVSGGVVDSGKKVFPRSSRLAGGGESKTAFRIISETLAQWMRIGRLKGYFRAPSL